MFFCPLDVRESRGAPRSCLGGPAFDPSSPSAATAGSVRSISHSWYSSRFSSRASRKKRAARNCCCRRHERSGGPTVPDLNRLGLKRVLIARQFRTIKAGTPPGGWLRLGLLRVRGALVGLVSGLVLRWVGVPGGVDDHVRRDGWTADGRCSARIGVLRQGLRSDSGSLRKGHGRRRLGGCDRGGPAG